MGKGLLFAVGLVFTTLIGATDIPCIPLRFPTPEQMYDTDTLTVRVNDDFATRGISYGTKASLQIYKSMARGCWIKIQDFTNLECQWGEAPVIMDVNGDNCEDIVLLKNFGTRGGNKYSYVFLFNQTTNQYDYLRGSAEHPNLSFDAEQQLIREVGYTSSVHYIWHRIEGDTLIPIKGYDYEADPTTNGSTMRGVNYTFSKNGEKKVVYIDQNPPGCWH